MYYNHFTQYSCSTDHEDRKQINVSNLQREGPCTPKFLDENTDNIGRRHIWNPHHLTKASKMDQ